MNTNRVPEGIPAGGQFAESTRAEASIALNDPAVAAAATLSPAGLLSAARHAEALNECPRHGGPWGDDETCEHCTDETGPARSLGDPGPIGAGEERVTFEFEADGLDSYTGSSSSGWGSKVSIISPEAGDGESFRWEVKQGGWTWDGHEPSLDAAKASATGEANRMLRQQENEPGGFDWAADDEDEEDFEW